MADGLLIQDKELSDFTLFTIFIVKNVFVYSCWCLECFSEKEAVLQILVISVCCLHSLETETCFWHHSSSKSFLLSVWCPMFSYHYKFRMEDLISSVLYQILNVSKLYGIRKSIAHNTNNDSGPCSYLLKLTVVNEMWQITYHL